MADLDNILSNIDLEEQKIETEEKDWYCGTCEHGPDDGQRHQLYQMWRET